MAELSKTLKEAVKRGLPDGVKPGYRGSPQGYPHMPTLAMCIPFSGRPIPPDIMFAYHEMSPPMNFNTVVFKSYGVPIADARNRFAEQALEKGAKYMFFWDEDVVPPPHALRELIFILEHRPEVAVIGAIYCLKSERPEPLVFRGIGNGPFWDWRVGEIFPVTALGMGCTLVRTEVFKDIPKPWFKSVDDMTRYLDNIPMGEQWTEDIYFCNKVVETKKWEILAHGQLICEHVNVITGQGFTLPFDSKPMRPISAKRGQKKILDIGSGKFPLQTEEGRVITLDARDDVNADYCCDFRRLPFAAGEFDVVHSSHSLEHVGFKETDTVLDEWIRVLSPKGELRLNLPNLLWAAKKLVESNGTIDTDIRSVLFGQQDYDTNFHRFGFTPESIRKMLEARGFVNFAIREQGYNILVSAWRYPKKSGKLQKLEKKALKPAPVVEKKK